MNCDKCGHEMIVSHVERQMVNGVEEFKKVYVCVNEKCVAYSTESRLKKRGM